MNLLRQAASAIANACERVILAFALLRIGIREEWRERRRKRLESGKKS